MLAASLSGGVGALSFSSSAVSAGAPPSPARYAYVFYAAEDAYACSALVNMARLRRFGLPANVDLVMLAHDTVSSTLREVAQEKFGALIYESSSFGGDAAMSSPTGELAGYYRHCFQKLMVFLLPQDVYRRVILMDADSLILRPPHHLFHLPEELPFALPQGYWLLPDEDTLTSWFMSVRKGVGRSGSLLSAARIRDPQMIASQLPALINVSSTPTCSFTYIIQSNIYIFKA